jgi:hypothetical protein
VSPPRVQEVLEQTLADLVRVVDTVDSHSNPRVAALVASLRTQLLDMHRDHDAKVIFFFNEPPDTLLEIPSCDMNPLPLPLPPVAEPEPPPPVSSREWRRLGHWTIMLRGALTEDSVIRGVAALFGSRKGAPPSHSVKKKQEFIKLFK